jgi:hypothetical protein
MKNKKHNEAKELISSIRNILFNDWDPLNVSTAMNADDEYDYLIGNVITLLKKKPPLEQIVEFLKDEEKKSGGMISLKSRENVALKLKSISDGI